MPDQRDPRKEKVTFFAYSDLKKEAMEILREMNSNLSEFFNYQLYKLVKENINEIKKEMSQLDGRTKKGKARIKAYKKAKSSK